MASVSTPPAQLDSDSEDEITFQASGLRLVKGSLGSSDPKQSGLVSCVSMDDENSEPNVDAKSKLRQKAMMARKKQTTTTTTSTTTTTAAAVKPPTATASAVPSPVSDSDDEEDMLLTQHQTAVSALPKTATLSEDLAHDFDESAFLPDQVTEVQETAPVEKSDSPPPPPAPSSTQPNDVSSVSSPSLSQTYSPSTHLPKYSESEYQLALTSQSNRLTAELTTSLTTSLTASLTASLTSKISLEFSKKEEEYTREFTELLEVSETEQNSKIKSLQASNLALTSKLAEVEKAHAETMSLTQSENDAVLEELLQKLDQFELSHNSKLLELQKKCNEKEAVVGALAPQLAEANNRNEELDKKVKGLEEEVGTLKDRIEEKETLASEQTDQINQLKKAHEAEVTVLKDKRVKAVEKMRFEMTKSAESQFAAANQHYHKLKEDFNLKVEECKKNEKSLESLKAKAVQSQKKAAAQEETHTATITQLKLQLATLTAKEASTTVSTRKKLSTLESSNASLLSKISTLQEESDAACMNLGKVVGEKEALVKENQDLQSVCEELMAIVEGNGK
ncbi:hypothetical protein TrVE_jg491 [Triparma verrucosa]|uniref:Uncharacterized protein n=1 Tax=Triparma verrucosa TaxID=1606542 RepID=A0A9W7BSU1_9STRA|nr:hypothetical protein TrVE_jg491 [Triparma verrucosa]